MALSGIAMSYELTTEMMMQTSKKRVPSFIMRTGNPLICTQIFDFCDTPPPPHPPPNAILAR